MASTNTYTSNYAGEKAGEIMRPVLVSGDSLANGYVNIHEGVKYKENIPVLTVSDDVIQAYACDWTAAGTTTTTEKVITPTRRMVNHEICKDTFLSTWFANDTGSALVDMQIPREWDVAFQDQLGKVIAQNEEYTLWQGNFESSTYTAYDGILKKADDDASTIKQNISALTTSNIIAQIRLATNAMTAAMIGDDTFRIKMNRKSAHLLRIAMQNDFGNPVFDDRVASQIDGYFIDICPGIPDDVIAIAKTDDLHVGVNLVSDITNLSIVDTSQTLNDNNVRIRAVWQTGTAVTNAGQIVLAGVGIES